MIAAAHLNDEIWWNKHKRTEAKSRVNNTAIEPILTYVAETRPETSKTKIILEGTEMKIARRIADCGSSGQICGKLGKYHLAPGAIKVNLT